MALTKNKNRENAGSKPVNGGSLLQWKGLMADADRTVLIMAYACLIVSVVAAIFTQLGFVPLFNVRLFTVLVPIAVSALLYGVYAGVFLGAIAGVASMLHAIVLPLDYYEKFLVSPINSVVCFTLTGLVFGLLFARLARKQAAAQAPVAAASANAQETDEPAEGESARPKVAPMPTGELVVASFIGSWFCSTFFQLAFYFIMSAIDRSVSESLIQSIAGYGNTAAQILLDGVLVAIAVCLAARMDSYRRNTLDEERPLRQTFQAWLSVVFAVAFMLIAALTYTAITVSCIISANNALDGHLEYVRGQLLERDSWLNHIEKTMDISSEAHEEALTESVSGVAKGLRLWDSGVTIVAEDNIVVSDSNDVYTGQRFDEILGTGLEGGYSEEVFNTQRPLEFYSGGGTQIDYLKATEISYMRVLKSGRYQVAAILSSTEVFATRTTTMILISLQFMLLLGLVYALSMRLLDQVVVKGIDETNETLQSITEGDLDRIVEVNDSREFSSLSRGINSTVGALKLNIAEAETRLNRELETAKAIQEGSLPSTFPPYPELDRFDIYANMNAAKEVGGDFYDFFLLDEDRIAIVLADVSGKGIPAALFMMSAKTDLEACLRTDMPLEEAVSTTNYHLCQNNEAGMFVTAFVAILNFRTGHMQYVNAGHNPPALRRKDGWEWLRDKSGLFLGAFDTLKLKPFETVLEEGDELLLYTDGVVEAMDKDEKLYSEERLALFLEQHSDLHPRALVDAIRYDLERWGEDAEQADDITLLAVEYGCAPISTDALELASDVELLPEVLDFVHGELTRRTCPLNVQNKIDVCLEELYVNVCDYAYEGEQGPVRVRYTYLPDPRGIRIEISDVGIPFDPLTVSRPDSPESVEDISLEGLGILMTKQLSDELTYEYRDGQNITSFIMHW